MGNATSCTPSIIPSSSHAAAKLLLPDGRLQLRPVPVSAGELMVEHPGKFVSESGSLKVGHRIVGLSADEALEARRLYFVLPMELLYSVLTGDEMAALSYRAAKALHHRSFSGLGKIFPVCISAPNDGGERLELAGALPEKSYSKQRSWKPALETIVESY